MSSKYGIPNSTLHNKIKHKVPNVTWILAKAKLGFPMHPEEVKASVLLVLKGCPRENKFEDDKPGEKWLQLFPSENQLEQHFAK